MVTTKTLLLKKALLPPSRESWGFSFAFVFVMERAKINSDNSPRFSFAFAFVVIMLGTHKSHNSRPQLRNYIKSQGFSWSAANGGLRDGG